MGKFPRYFGGGHSSLSFSGLGREVERGVDNWHCRIHPSNPSPKPLSLRACLHGGGDPRYVR